MSTECACSSHIGADSKTNASSHETALIFLKFFLLMFTRSQKSEEKQRQRTENSPKWKFSADENALYCFYVKRIKMLGTLKCTKSGMVV
jgi:hypothetical protein